MERIDQVLNNNKNFEELLTNANLSEEYKTFIRNVASLNIMIDLYTTWETSARELLYKYFRNFREILLQDNFFRVYLENMFSTNKYIKNKFLKDLEQANPKIRKKLILSSNNLNFNNYISLIRNLLIDIKKADITDFFKKCFLLAHCVDTLRPRVSVVTRDGVRKSVTRDGVRKCGYEMYLDELVEIRNVIAHTGLVELYSNEVREAYINFMKNLYYSFDCMFNNYIIKQFIKKNIPLSIKKFNITNIFCENSINDNAIIFSEVNKLNTESVFLEFEDNFYKIEIMSIMNPLRRKCKAKIQSGQRTFKIFSPIKIKKKKIDKYKLVSIDFPNKERNNIEVKFEFEDLN